MAKMPTIRRTFSCWTSRPTIWTWRPRKCVVAALENYEGTMLFVSHDRRFLAAVNRVLELTPDGIHNTAAAIPNMSRAPAGGRWVAWLRRRSFARRLFALILPPTGGPPWSRSLPVSMIEVEPKARRPPPVAQACGFSRHRRYELEAEASPGRYLRAGATRQTEPRRRRAAQSMQRADWRHIG